MKSGLNWYRYCDNNPLKSIDPSGLEIRELTPSEVSQVEQSIADLRANGEVEAANDLESKLKPDKNGKRKIKVDTTGVDYADTIDDTIYISEDTFNLLKNDRRSTSEKSSDRIFFDSLLLHEWVHTRQGKWKRIYQNNIAEDEAWAYQQKYLSRVLGGYFKRYEAWNPAYVSLVEYILARIDECSGQRREYIRNARWWEWIGYP